MKNICIRAKWLKARKIVISSQYIREYNEIIKNSSRKRLSESIEKTAAVIKIMRKRSLRYNRLAPKDNIVYILTGSTIWWKIYDSITM